MIKSYKVMAYELVLKSINQPQKDNDIGNKLFPSYFVTVVGKYNIS